jgi:hypothetical protein
MKAYGYALVVIMAAMVGVHPGESSAAVLYGVSEDNYLISMDSTIPGTFLASRPITGLQSSEKIVGLDYSSTGTLYGLGDSSRLYTISVGTGQATAVGSGQFSPTLDGTAFGFDNIPSGAAVISDLGQSLTISRATGAALTNPWLLPLSLHVSALAYASDSGFLYGIDSLANTLVTINQVTGTATTIGPLGIDCSRNNGFDISSESGVAYLATPAASSDPAANLYQVNLSTGAVTLVGLIGAPGDDVLVRGLTVVPEPASLSLLILGGLTMLRRKRA